MERVTVPLRGSIVETTEDIDTKRPKARTLYFNLRNPKS